MILCRFYRDFYQWDELAELFAMTTGQSLDKAGLRALAARVTDNTRRFNIREGLTADDDRLPPRMTAEKLKSGLTITKQEVDTLVRDYYRLRGWTPDGIPSEHGINA